MGKLLIIAEKPSVARDIASAIGGFSKVESWMESDKLVVSSAIGHLVEIFTPLAQTSGRTLADLPVVPDAFDLRAIEHPDPKRNTKPQFLLLCRLMARNDIDGVVNACDAGREGELIFRLVYEHAGCKKPTQRMWLQSMTAEAILDAYKGMKPGSIFDNLADAARCRAEADWLVGINGTRGTSKLREKKTNKVDMSPVGRVQTPTLAIVVDRENQIRFFRPQHYWEIHGTFGLPSGNFVGRWFDPNAKESSKEGETTHASRILDRNRAAEILARCQGADPGDITDEFKPSMKAAPALFDLTTLQREANKKFGLSAQETLTAAQELYEKYKATSYPRTDSSALPEDYVPTAKKIVRTLAGVAEYQEFAQKIQDSDWVKPVKKIFDNSKISDHFAIIPTGQHPTSLPPNEQRIYDLVVRRFLAAFFPAAEYHTTTRITTVGGEKFRSSGRVLAQPGWLAVYGAEEDDEKTPALTKYTAGDAMKTERLEFKTLQTKPPARYTEADLLGAMEKAGKFVEDEELAAAMKERGLGTPATRASILENLLSKGPKDKPKEPYLIREGKVMAPTPKGMELIAFLNDNGIHQLTSPEMTGDWEAKLHKMEKGAYPRSQFMRETADLVRHILDVIRAQAAKIQVRPIGKCPKCGGSVIASSRTYECQAECGFVVWREVASRQITLSEIQTLLIDGKIGNLNNFHSKPEGKAKVGKAFSAGLEFDADFKLKFVFEKKEFTRETVDANGNPVECYVCHKEMHRIKGQKGFFWGCSDRNCGTTMVDENGLAVKKERAPTSDKTASGKNVLCPQCKKTMIRRPGKNGFFWGCSGFPSCKKTLQDKDGEPVFEAEKRPAPSKTSNVGVFL